MNQYKRLLNNTFIFTIGTFSSKLLVFFMMRFYTGIMSPDSMGIADLILKTTSILYPIASLAIGQAVIRFALEKSADKSAVFSTGIFTVLIGFAASFVLFPILGLLQYDTSAGTSASLLPYGLLIYIYVLTSCTQNVCGQFIRSIGYVKLYAIDGIFRTALNILFNILYLAVFGWDIYGYVLSVVTSDLISTICLFLIARLHRYCSTKHLHRNLWGQMLRYSLPLVPGMILVFVIGFSDTMLLASMRNTAESGIYSVAYKIPTMITTIAAIFIDAWQISSINDNTREDQIRFFSNVGNGYAAIVCIVSSGAIMCSKLAMFLIAAPKYYIGWSFIPILAIGSCFSCLSSFQNSIYTLEKKTVNSFISTAIAAFLNIGMNVLLIPRYGGNGAAIATLASYLLLFAYRVVDSRRFLPIRWNGGRMLISFGLMAIQIIVMLAELPFWIPFQVILFGMITLLNSKELMIGIGKVFRRA